MKAALRIVGQVKVAEGVKETLHRMRIRRKYTLVLLPADSAAEHLLASVRNFIAYGDVDKETLAFLLQKRAQPIDKKKKIDSVPFESIAEQLIAGKKSLADFNIKPFFRLHPPRGGIDARLHFPKKKGVLGDNKEHINALIRRML